MAKRAAGVSLVALIQLAQTFKAAGKSKADLVAEVMKQGGYASEPCVDQRLHTMRAKIEEIGLADPNKGQKWVDAMLESVKFEDARKSNDEFGSFLSKFSIGDDGVARPKNKGKINLA